MTPQQLYGSQAKRRDAGEFVPQPMEVTGDGSLKIDARLHAPMMTQGMVTVGTGWELKAVMYEAHSSTGIQWSASYINTELPEIFNSNGTLTTSANTGILIPAPTRGQAMLLEAAIYNADNITHNVLVRKSHATLGIPGLRYVALVAGQSLFYTADRGWFLPDVSAFSAGGVTTDMLAAAAVTTAKLADANVTAAKLEESMRRSSNIVINGDGIVSQRSAYTLATSGMWGFGVDRFAGMATAGTSVAGTFSAVNTPLFLRNRAFKFNGVTLVGTGGEINMRTRIEGKDGQIFNARSAIARCQIYHNIGSSKVFTIEVSTANSLDNFSATTLIGTASLSIPSGSKTELSVAIGTLSGANGIEIKINGVVGSISSKDIYIGEVQLDIGTVAIAYNFRTYAEELARCQRYYETGDDIFNGNVTNGTGYYNRMLFAVHKRIAPASGNMTFGNTSNVLFPTGPSAWYASSTGGVTVVRTANGTGSGIYGDSWIVDVEL